MNWNAWVLAWVDAQLEAVWARVDVLTALACQGFGPTPIVKVTREQLRVIYPEPEGARRRRKRKGRR